MSIFKKEIVNDTTRDDVKELKETLRLKNEEIRNLEKNFESKERILRNELDIVVQKKIKEQVDLNNDLKGENAVVKKENEILTRAFENMGFDVKDMKDILNKLVDGIVLKNQINLVK